MGCGLSKAPLHHGDLLSHRHARTTVHGRLLIVQRHQDGMRKAHIAAAVGISRQCADPRITRYAAEGESGLHDRSTVDVQDRVHGPFPQHLPGILDVINDLAGTGGPHRLGLPGRGPR